MMNQFSPKVSQVLAFSREEAQRLSCKQLVWSILFWEC